MAGLKAAVPHLRDRVEVIARFAFGIFPGIPWETYYQTSWWFIGALVAWWLFFLIKLKFTHEKNFHL
jgi:hypothetical protein